MNVTASSYGNSVSYTPEDQAYSAIDNNFDTAWITGTFVPDPKGQWWQAQFTNPVTTDHITLVQPQRGDRSRWVSKVTLTFDGKDPVTYELNASSHVTSGQTLTFPSADLPHPAGDHRRHDGQHGAAAGGLRRRLLRDRDPRPAGAPGRADADPDAHQPGRRLGRRPPHRRHDRGNAPRSTRPAAIPRRRSRASSPCRRPAPSRWRAAPACPPSSPTTRSTAWWAGPRRRRARSGTPTRRAACPATSAPRRRPPSTGTRPRPGSPGSARKAQVGSTLTYDLAKPQTLTRAQHAGDRRRPPLGPDGHDDHLGQPDAHVTVPPIADSTVPGAVTTVPVTFPAAHRLALRRHVHRRAPRVRGQLLLRRPARAAARHRGDRHPRRARRTRRRRRCRATACPTC